MFGLLLVLPFAFLGLSLCYLISLELIPHPLPKSLPSVGFRKEILGRARASFRQILGTSQTLAEGYKQYGAHERPFVVPDTTFRPQVMIPQKHVKWLSTQPESVLSSEAVRWERNALAYLPTTSPRRSSTLFIDKIIGQSLSQNLDVIQSDMYDEIRETVDNTFGMDTESWKEINLTAAMSSIIDRTGNRVLFGLSVCRNESYLKALRRYIVLMGASTLIIGQLPPWILRPIIAYMLIIPTFIAKKKAEGFVRPLVKERMRTVSENELGEKDSAKTAHDFVTQSVKAVKKFKIFIPGDASVYLAEQFLFLAFAAMATTGAGATNIFLDILSTPAETNLYETLRAEAAATFRSEADWASPASMKSMAKTDSTIRESLRRNTLQSRGLLKRVMPREGVILPDGTHLPQGTWVGVPVQAMQRDENLYSNAFEYDPMRFARLKQASEPESKDESGAAKNLDAAQPSDQYLSFSYGRSSCPGRWFAALMLKLMIAYITLNYDIQPLAERPTNISFGDASIASFTTNISVRRRKSG